MAIAMVDIEGIRLIFIIGVLLFSPAFYYLQRKFILIMKTRYPDKWEELGKPSLWFNTMQQGTRMMKFFIHKEYLELKDPELTKICQLDRSLSFIYIVFFLIIAIFGSWLISDN